MQVSVKRDKGVLKVDIDGKKIMPLSFKSFRPNPNNISEFYAAGIRLFSVLSSGIDSALGVPYSLFGESWVGEYEYDFSAIDRQMDMFIENAPEAYFAPMLQLDTREWFLEKYPDIPNSFFFLSQMCTDNRWRDAASAYLCAAIEHLEEKYGSKIYGYFLLCGTTTEWFSSMDSEAPHPIKEKAYKAWKLDTGAALPTKEEHERIGDVFLSEAEENIYSAHKFHAEIITDTALHFAKLVKKITNRKKLVGMYYGYILELRNQELFNFGILDYERLYLSEDIDMISSPSSYYLRGQLDPSGFMVTQKTLDEHNKLYFLEFDHITHIAPEMIYEKSSKSSSNKALTKIPGAESKCKNQTETLNLMYRDYILCNAHGATLWWFDMFDGWFRSEEMMSLIKNVIEFNEALGEKERKSCAEVAVFLEGRSMYRVRKSAGLESYALEGIKKPLASSGVSYELYSISDIFSAEIESYKLIILANQYEISKEVHTRVKKLQELGISVMYTYTPDYKCRPDTVFRLTGIKTSVLRENNGALLIDGKSYPNTLPPPYFSVDDESVTPIACYENGKIAAAYKKSGALTFYNTFPAAPASLIKTAAKLSGAHIYSESEDVFVYPSSVCVGVYNASSGDAIIHLLEDGVYKDALGGKEYTQENGTLIIKKDELRAFLLIKKED